MSNKASELKGEPHAVSQVFWGLGSVHHSREKSNLLAVFLSQARLQKSNTNLRNG